MRSGRDLPPLKVCRTIYPQRVGTVSDLAPRSRMATNAQLRAYQRYGFPSKKKVEPVPVVEIEEPAPEPAPDPILELARAVLALASREIPAPMVHVAIPEQQAPVVNVDVQVPEQPAPIVRVNVPQQPAPQVSVQPPSVNVTNQVPGVQDIRIVSTPPIDAKIDRDPRGFITRIRDTD